MYTHKILEITPDPIINQKLLHLSYQLRTNRRGTIIEIIINSTRTGTMSLSFTSGLRISIISLNSLNGPMDVCNKALRSRNLKS